MAISRRQQQVVLLAFQAVQWEREPEVDFIYRIRQVDEPALTQQGGLGRLQLTVSVVVALGAER